MPKRMHKEFGEIIQGITERVGEIAPKVILDKFTEEYLEVKGPFKLIKFKVEDNDSIEEIGENTKIKITIAYNGKEKIVEAKGNGPIDSLKKVLVKSKLVETSIMDYIDYSCYLFSSIK